jgi:arylsulfatase A-like enzyme/Flp pilus assembly protein TadD
MRRGLRFFTSGVVAVAATFLGGCRRESFRGAPVVLITIDTLRADHLPAYGYGGVETPAIDALRKDGILFRNAYSHVPLTLPSHASIMTGLLPPRNGVRDNLGYSLSSSRATIASLLRGSGYATGAAVSAVVLASSTGISAGFDAYDDDITSLGEWNIGNVQRSGFETEKIAEKWIEKQGAKPFFYFLHLYEPHTPYTPPEPYLSRYRSSPYDGEIATADAVVGRFVAFLREKQLYDRSLVVLLSDHGEGLGQHGEDEHGLLLYRETLHVPLLLKLPGARRSGTTIDGPAGLVDVLPTVAGALGVAIPRETDGVSLLAEGRDATRRIYSETFYPRYHFGWSDLAALTDDRYGYIHGAVDELYDLAADPGELHDLAPGLPPSLRARRNALLSMDRPEHAPGAADPEQVKKLASLGYLGSGPAAAPSGPLPDPRSHLSELHDIRTGFTLMNQNRLDEARKLFASVAQRNPGMVDAWSYLANAAHKEGRDREALEALRTLDRLQPGSGSTLSMMSQVLYDLGEREDARLFAERSIVLNGPVEAHEVLAAIAVEKKDFDTAEREARLVIARNRNRPQAGILLARSLRGRGDLAGALAQLDETEAHLPPGSHVSDLAYLRGDILARLDRTTEAEHAFRQEIETFPENPAGWTGLALLDASQGRSTEARALLSRMVQTAPGPRSRAAAAATLRVLSGN